MPRATAIYVRISKDDRGDLLGVKRQEKDCRALAARKGWPVTELYVDDDVSAYVPGKRPEYARLLADMKEGRVDSLVVYDLDRLHRHPWELEEFFRTCDAAAVTHLASVSGDFDLATSDGQLMARIMGAVAKKSSDDGSRRLQRKHQELAEAGKPSGGGARPFGYEYDGMRIVPDEAEMIRDAARRLLMGEPMASICRGWNDAGMLTGSGSLWRVGTLRNMLLSPRLAGLRAYKGEIVGEAAWQAILERPVWEQVRALLTDPARRQERPARASLLTHLARCGRCKAKLVVAPVEGRATYRCQKGPGKLGCGGLAIVAAPFEDIIEKALLHRCDSPGFLEALSGATADGDAEGAEAAAAITKAEAKLAELAQMWAASEITRAEWMAARRPVEAALDAARRRIRRRTKTTAIEGLTAPGALREQWPSLPLHRKRAILAAALDRIEVAPARRGYNRFDPLRIDPIWRA